MKDIKSIVANNLGVLRKQRGITQAELAEKLNYSDKAISRWEKGDTLPDINVLYEICEFYGITMNDLTSEACTAPQIDEAIKHQRMYKIWTCALAGVTVWLFAMLWFIFNLETDTIWITFLWAIPISCAVVMIIGRATFNWLVHFILASVIVWSTMASLYLHIMFFGTGANFWYLFVVGVPLQAIVFLFQRTWITALLSRKNKKQALEEENADRQEESN